MFIRFDVIHERDGQTLHDSKDRAYTPCPDEKGATDFFAVTFTNIDGFS